MLRGAANRILLCFSDTDVWNFADLCKRAGYPTDLGGYYLRQLVQHGYLEVIARGRYAITPKGRSQLAVAHGKQIFVTRPRLLVMMVAKQEDRYVVLRRTQQPFIGIAEWPASSVQLGESMAVAVTRLAKERFGTSQKPSFVGFFRRTDLYDDEVFDDKVFAVHMIELPPSVKIMEKNRKGIIELRTASELANIRHPSKSLLDIQAYVQGKSSLPYEEHEYILQSSDFSSDNDT